MLRERIVIEIWMAVAILSFGKFSGILTKLADYLRLPNSMLVDVHGLQESLANTRFPSKAVPSLLA